jgi:hypothetical protein
VRDNKISGVIGQVLHFPTVCHPKYYPRGKYEFGSYVQNADNVVLSDVRFEAFLDAYMPPSTLVDAESDERRDVRHSPLLADSLGGLPPACKY